MLSYFFGKGKTEESKPENENPELAMRDALDLHGAFATKFDGSLEYKDFLIFRAIIMRQACRTFQPKREELTAKKIEAFKAKDQAAYVRIFREGQIHFQNAVLSITKKACEWIDLEPENYSISLKAFMEDEQKRAEI